MNSNLLEKIKSLPELPGCYLWKNSLNEIIYVGKAKNIKNRTNQYFQKRNDNSKLKLLVNQIYDIDFIVTDSENDALILERNLITEYKPRYNTLLREKGNYPYIILTNEKHPRLIYSANEEKYDGKKYGPFAIQSANKFELYLIAKRLFGFRKCKTLPSKKCIYYDIGQCLGPCINKINENDYINLKKELDDFFSGKFTNIKKYLKDKELLFAKNLDFESAQLYLELQKSIDNILITNETFFNKKLNIDVIGYYSRDSFLTIVIFKYKQGNLLQSYVENNFVIDEEQEFLYEFIKKYYANQNNNIKSIYINLDDEYLSKLNNEYPNIQFSNPKKGKLSNSLILATKNAKIINESKYYKLIDNFLRNESSLQELKKLIDIDDLTLIEMYDNSNMNNDQKVGVKVSYLNGYKEKSLYRKFTLKSELSSDYEMMEELIFRRFKNIYDEDLLPNLIIVDGGQIQINAAKNALAKLNLENIVNVAGLVKNNKHQTDRLLYNNKEYLLDKKSNLYLFLLNIQEEVHRFAISFFRDKKSISLYSNELLLIKGVGKKTLKILLDNFQTIENIKNASVNELSKFITEATAINIKNYFSNN